MVELKNTPPDSERPANPSVGTNGNLFLYKRVAATAYLRQGGMQPEDKAVGTSRHECHHWYGPLGA